MKRQERHHLKENELAHSLAAARDYIEPRTRQIAYVIGALVLVVIAILAVNAIRQRSGAEAQAMLADAMVTLNARVVPSADPETAALPAAAQFNATGTFATDEARLKAALPKLQATADQFPDTHAGVVARYHLAGALAALGQNGEAVKQFDEVVQRTGTDDLYGRMARMGKADSQVRAGQLDEAIASWQALADQNDPNLPADAILMELARAHAAKGNTEDARRTFTELVDQHPDSPYSTEARAELDTLKG